MIPTKLESFGIGLYGNSDNLFQLFDSRCFQNLKCFDVSQFSGSSQLNWEQLSDSQFAQQGISLSLHLLLPEMDAARRLFSHNHFPKLRVLGLHPLGASSAALQNWGHLNEIVDLSVSDDEEQGLVDVVSSELSRLVKLRILRTSERTQIGESIANNKSLTHLVELELPRSRPVTPAALEMLVNSDSAANLRALRMTISSADSATVLLSPNKLRNSIHLEIDSELEIETREIEKRFPNATVVRNDLRVQF